MSVVLDITPQAIPVMPRGVRLHHDKVRGIWVLLAPERTINLDPIGLAILRQIDGENSLSNIIQRLAQLYDAPADQIGSDVREFIAGLMKRRILDLRP